MCFPANSARSSAGESPAEHNLENWWVWLFAPPLSAPCFALAARVTGSPLSHGLGYSGWCCRPVCRFGMDPIPPPISLGGVTTPKQTPVLPVPCAGPPATVLGPASKGRSRREQRALCGDRKGVGRSLGGSRRARSRQKTSASKFRVRCCALLGDRGGEVACGVALLHTHPSNYFLNPPNLSLAAHPERSSAQETAQTRKGQGRQEETAPLDPANSHGRVGSGAEHC